MKKATCIWPPAHSQSLSENIAYISISSEKILYITLKTKHLVEKRARSQHYETVKRPINSQLHIQNTPSCIYKKILDAHGAVVLE